MLLKVAPDQPQGSETAAEEAPLTAYPALEGSQSLLSTTPMKQKEGRHRMGIWIENDDKNDISEKTRSLRKKGGEGLKT